MSVNLLEDQSSLPRVNALHGDRVNVLLGLMILLLLRIAYCYFCPLELVPDEAYYWDWSRQLDWGYYSKPPMVAWLIALATTFGGHNEVAIRIPAAVLGTIGLYAIYELVRQMFDPRTAIWAVVIVAVTPGMTAMSFLMTIDAPFLCAWSVALCCLWKLLDSDRVSAPWLFGAIGATGFGLLSKQTMLSIYPLLMLFCLTARSDWKVLKSIRIFIWAIASLTFLVPVIIWNASHDWITVQHTREHFQSTDVAAWQHLGWLMEFWGSQFVILSPIICGLMLVICWSVLFRFRHIGRRERFLICFGALPMIPVTVLSFIQHVQPNWPAPFQLTSLILLTVWGTKAISCDSWIERGRRLFGPATAVGALMSAILLSIPFLLPSSPLSGTTVDATIRLRGWKMLGVEAGKRLLDFPNPDDAFVVAATGRSAVSELSFYLPGQPRVYRWNLREVINSQHDVWGGPSNASGRDALIITQSGDDVPDHLAKSFESIENRGTIVIPLGRNRSRVFHVWRGVALTHWPRPGTGTESIAASLGSTSL